MNTIHRSNLSFLFFFCTIPGCSKGYKDLFHSGDQEPWVFRGGVQGEIQVCITDQPPAADHPYRHFTAYIYFVLAAVFVRLPYTEKL